MERQRFVVTLEVPPAFARYMPGVEVDRLAKIVRDAVWDKSCSFAGPIPFKITVEKGDKVASASGEMREYLPDEFRDAIEEPALKIVA